MKLVQLIQTFIQKNSIKSIFILFLIFLFCFQTSIVVSFEHESMVISSTSEFNYQHYQQYHNEVPTSLHLDGYFNGTWQSQYNSNEGCINGSIIFGRSDTSGIIRGTISSATSSDSMDIHATILNQLLIGRIYYQDTQKTCMVFGVIQAEMPAFTFFIYIPSLGLIQGNGEYIGSFLPSPTGPFNVGVRSCHVVDKSRDEWFTENDKSDYRELMINIWYPTLSNDFDKRKEYMDEVTFSWLRDQGPVPLITIPKEAYTFVHPYLYENVSQVDGKSFPVLLFSPGYDGVDAIYTSFIDELVSYGYIVVSMNHPYVSGVTVFPDGEINYIAELPGNYSESYDFLLHSQQTVIDDALFVLDIIEEFNRTDSALSGMFDCSRIGMFGHSFGGAATINCCYEDDRITAGLTLDGVVYDEFIMGNITCPFLLLCAEQRFNHSSYEYVWNHFSSDAFQVGVLGSSHYGFTDVGVLLSHLLPNIPSSILGFGTVDSHYLIQITRQLEKAFFDVYLKGMEKETLVDLLDDYDIILVKIK